MVKTMNKDNYLKISDEQYVSYFGLKNPENKDLHKAAFKKAWETRNYEIDKFWQRSMFFWGFIVLIFTGYVKVITEKDNQSIKVMNLDFYLILLGLIFSVAWILIILGSKRWQENWEKHIDYLEDEITGPLYKTLYYKGKKYYSVSGINLILAWVVLVTWIFLLLQYFYNNITIIKNFILNFCNSFHVILFLFLPLVFTVICIFYFLLYKGQTDGGKLNKELEKGGSDVFYIKKQKGEETE